MGLSEELCTLLQGTYLMGNCLQVGPHGDFFRNLGPLFNDLLLFLNFRLQRAKEKLPSFFVPLKILKVYASHLYRVFFFTGPPLKKTKSKIVLEYPDWASSGPPKKVKVHRLGLTQIQ